MAPGEMAEARPETPKKYSCACGLSQDDKKKQFSGKCRHCHTRPKFLRGQSSFDSGSASRGGTTCAGGLSPSTTPSSSIATTPPSSHGLQITGATSPGGTNHRSGTSCSCRAGGVRDNRASSRDTTNVPQMAPLSRRRSRSVDRCDVQQIIGNPPPPYYATLSSGRGQTTARNRRNDINRLRSGDRQRVTTPPPCYDVVENLRPPSYEEALANSLSHLSTSSSLSALIAATPDLRTPAARPSSLHSDSGDANQRGGSQWTAGQGRISRRSQRQAEREAQLELERQMELDLERERQMELQVAKYCGCAKCQAIYYHYCYEDPMNQAATFPMETQVLMHEVLTDGLAFCSLM